MNKKKPKKAGVVEELKKLREKEYEKIQKKDKKG
jgi:hypothetical protein